MIWLWRVAAGTAIVLWLASLALPAVATSNNPQIPGYMVLLLGWMGPILQNDYGWFANLFILYAAPVLMLPKVPPIILAALVLPIAPLLVLATRWTLYPWPEAGNPTIVAHHIGYDLWFAAGWLVFGAGLARAAIDLFVSYLPDEG